MLFTGKSIEPLWFDRIARVTTAWFFSEKVLLSISIAVLCNAIDDLRGVLLRPLILQLVAEFRVLFGAGVLLRSIGCGPYLTWLLNLGTWRR